MWCRSEKKHLVYINNISVSNDWCINFWWEVMILLKYVYFTKQKHTQNVNNEKWKSNFENRLISNEQWVNNSFNILQIFLPNVYLMLLLLAFLYALFFKLCWQSIKGSVHSVISGYLLLPDQFRYILWNSSLKLLKSIVTGSLLKKPNFMILLRYFT